MVVCWVKTWCAKKKVNFKYFAYAMKVGLSKVPRGKPCLKYQLLSCSGEIPTDSSVNRDVEPSE